MRLLRRGKGRAAVPVPDGWVAPTPGSEPVVLGTLDGDARPTVDRAGLLRVDDAWALDWWIGAADRWHVPARERASAIGQRQVDGTPVVETTVRIPGGTAVHRAWCVRSGETDWAVVEVENRSRDAVAVALAVRPTARRVAFEGTTVDVDGTLLRFTRAPAHAVLGTAATGDVAEVVLASAASGAAPGEVTCRTGLAHGAFVFPLAHTATLRAAVRLDDGGDPVDLASLPDHEAVARGWSAHLDAGVRVALPDEDLASRVRTARGAALLSPGPATLGALDRWGHGAAAELAFDALVEAGGPASVEEAAAAARHALLRGDAALVEPLLVPLAAAAHKARHGAPAIAAALDLAGQPDAAAAVRALGGGEDASPWLEAFGASLVDDGDDGLVALVPTWPDAWLGRDLDVSRVPTRWGPVSFAVRWHGPRPAVLWEAGDRVRTVTAPGLDPSWSSGATAGEALLGAIEPPGGLPGVVKPLDLGGTPAAEAGEGGEFA